MPKLDNTDILFEGQVINASGTTTYSNIIDVAGSDSVTTNAASWGFGAGKPKYIVVYTPIAFTTVTSVQVQLQTSDAYTSTALSGTVTTIWDSTAIAIASLATAGGVFPGTPFIIPVKGCKQYIQLLVTTVGPSTSEVGSLTSYVTDDVQSLQVPTYGSSPVAY